MLAKVLLRRLLMTGDSCSNPEHSIREGHLVAVSLQESLL